MKMSFALAAAVLAAGLAGCGRPQPPPGAAAGARGASPRIVQVTGAGASFPAPLYAKWAAEYNRATGARVNYQSVGSGAGLKQIEANTVDFGASDMPLKDEDLARKGLVQFPTVIGGVVPVVNLEGVAPGQLRLTGQVLGDIYLGKITRWSDPALQALNPGLKLPATMIAPVRRADGSGTTFLFTHYLSQVNADWKGRVGEGTAVKWPAGVGGKGNEGVAAFVSRLPGTIGYVEYTFATQNRMKYVLLQNAAGQFVAPQGQGFQAAAAGADWGKSFYQVLTNQADPQAWPITGATFILVHKAQDKPAQAAQVLRFFDWAARNGDASAIRLAYVPLPDALKAQVRQLWDTQIKAGGSAVAYHQDNPSALHLPGR